MRDLSRYFNNDRWKRGFNNQIHSRGHLLLQHKDKQLAKECAKKIGLRLKGFQANDKLELFFDVYKGEDNICYLSKGWGDPGFRIGEYIEIDKDISNFKNRFYRILNTCSKNLISVGASEPEPGKIGISLEIGLYQQGFNEEVLKEAIDSLEDSLQGIRIILES